MKGINLKHIIFEQPNIQLNHEQINIEIIKIYKSKKKHKHKPKPIKTIIEHEYPETFTIEI
jgi:hypothetical protein